MPFIGLNNRTYIRKRETPIFPSRSKLYPTDGYIIHPCKDGFGAYLTYIQKLNRSTGGMRSRPVMSGAYGEVLFSRIEVAKEASYSIWEYQEEVYACLAFSKGRIYYGATFGEGMIINFDGGFVEYIDYEKDNRNNGYRYENRQDACEEAKTQAWKLAEEAARIMSEHRAEEIEEDQREQEEERSNEESEARDKARELLDDENYVVKNVSIEDDASVSISHREGKTFAKVTASFEIEVAY